MKPEEQMLIGAVRYALGRQSYIVGDTCAFVASVRKKLSKKCINIIIRDIRESISFYRNIGKHCGDIHDEHDWELLLEMLVEEVQHGKDG